MDTPRGVVALVNPGNSDDSGGSAVLLSETGLLLSLAEALPADPARITVVLPGGQRRAASVVRQDGATTAVLLQMIDPPAGLRPLQIADSRRIQLCDPVWTVGNASGTIELDGLPAISRGVVSGLYELPEERNPARGRLGRILSTYRGPAIETDAAINDGNQGGALLDNAGRLIGLTSRANARERRLPLTVPLARILDGLDLQPADTAPAGGGEAWRRAASRAAASLALLYLERPQGPGNPTGVPRPSRLPDQVPAADRERLQGWWERYWHQQQVFLTDQPVSAIALDDDLILTAASNLHGGAERGRLLLSGGAIVCTVVGRDLPLDLALLRCERPHGLPPVQFRDQQPELATPVALLGRHRNDSSWTATIGVISATDRRRAQSRLAFLQTDARANYGSLGGPLVDADGRMVGLCVLLGPADERPWLINSGVAMAIDSGRIREALPGMIAGRTTERPAILGLGVVLRQRSGRLVVERVIPGSGAAEAGLQSGDVLESVSGARATSPEAITRVLLRRQTGDRIPVVLRRNDTEMPLQVELRELTDGRQDQP
jgi:S1-C subfamily serine protease